MRFILFTHEFPPFQGGVGTYCSELAHALHKKGHSIEVWAPDYLQPETLQEETFPFPVHRLHYKGTLKIKDLIALGKITWNRRHYLKDHIILLPSVGSQIIFMMATLLRLLPLEILSQAVCIWHGSEIFKFKANKLLWIGAHAFFPKAKILAAASQYSTSIIKTSFLSRLGHRVITLPCACGTWATKHPPDSLPPQESSPKIKILTLARLHPRKGHIEIIEALGKLSEEEKIKIIYQIAGKGSQAYLDSLLKRAETLQIHTEYLGAIKPEALSQTYHNCDIYAMTSIILPTSVEGFGITYLEAGFHAKPVIGYNTGGVREAVIDGQTGIVVEEGNREDLTKAFQKLINNSSLRKEMGIAGAKHASKFNWESTAEKLVKEVMSS